MILSTTLIVLFIKKNKKMKQFIQKIISLLYKSPEEETKELDFCDPDVLGI